MRDLLRTLLGAPAAAPGDPGDDRLLREQVESAARREAALSTAVTRSGIVLFELDSLLRPLWVLGPDTALPAAPSPDRRRLDDAAQQVLSAGQDRSLSLAQGGQVQLSPVRDRGGRVTGVAGVVLPSPALPMETPPAPRSTRPGPAPGMAGADILARANHDLRQPMQAMRLYLHLLETKLDSPQQRDLAQRLGEALETGAEQLSAVLDLACLDAGRTKVSATSVPLGPALARIADALHPDAERRGLRLRTVPSRLVAHTDPVLLDRMLRALTENAVRFTRAGRVLLGVRRAGNRVSIQVWDSGPGIPAERQVDIFEPFVQMTPPDEGRRGLGLGLSLVERTARLLGADIAVRSWPGWGSCFSLVLPTTPPAAVTAPSPPTAIPLLAGRVIALAEDDRLQLAALEATVQDWGCDTVIGGSLPELQAALRQAGRVPDLIISDFRLPGGQTGLSLVETLRRDYGRPIAGLLLTGDAHPDLQAQARAAGLGILHKPVHPARLRRAVEQALAGG